MKGLKIIFISIRRILQARVLPFIQGHATPERIVFQQDGAPPHHARVNTDWLSQNIPLVCSIDCRHNQNLGINQFLLEWPPYSMDMTPMDFGNVFIFALQVVLCQINIFCHRFTQNATTNFVRFTKIYTNCSEIQNLQNFCFEFV